MTMSRRTLLKACAAAGAAAVGGSGAYGFFLERHALALTRVSVPVSGLPSALAGFRIGLLTDVHRSRWVSADDVARGVGALMAARPDLIVLGGDYVTWGDRTYVEPSAEALSGLSAPHGVFAVLGNHDDDHDMPSALVSRGIEVLRDERTDLTVDNAILSLVGLRYWTRRRADIERLARGARGTQVLLAHDPRRLQEAAELGIPLVLSGHTHGGQVVLPGLGAVAAHKFPVVAGLARRGHTSLFVSRGVGTVYVPVRVNCSPEVAVLSLQPG